MHAGRLIPCLDGAQNPGEWIEAQCRELGVSVAEIAREARIDRSTIFRWKVGDRSPNWDNFNRVRAVVDGYWSRRDARRSS